MMLSTAWILILMRISSESHSVVPKPINDSILVHDTMMGYLYRGWLYDCILYWPGVGASMSKAQEGIPLGEESRFTTFLLK
ncbi:hypothetical protein VTL71DRAFT_2996 [Oculimacula yallundae]|uniref:Secreted protein n=1 Tax=Oculimacula yallundae TaxID=86028 RepID=A0ABR4C742_9HELO